MTSTKQLYSELLHLTQLFLLREHSLSDNKAVDPAAFTFFQSKIKSSNPVSSAKEVGTPSFAPNSWAENLKAPLPAAIPPLQSIPSKLEPQQPAPQQWPPSEPLPSPTQPEPIIPNPSPPPPPTAQEKKGKKKDFSLEPLSAAPFSRDPRELWKLAQALFPDWILSEKIPNDAVAQKNKNIWQKQQEISPIIILSFHDDEQQFTFLKNLAQAISLRLARARIVSVSKLQKDKSLKEILSSPQLRLVIASDYGLYLEPELMHLYRESPDQNKHFLNQIPLLLLSDLSLYLKEPQLKPLLWRAICKEFAALQ